MKDVKEMTEAELREAESFWPKTEGDLTEYIENLVTRDHDYGTCVYAMSLAAVATFHYVAHRLGVTGFQASCADLDFLKRTRSMKSGFMILNYEHLLFPQYLTDEHFPGWERLIEQNKETLAKAAKKKLAESKDAHPEVLKHWQMLANKEVI